MALSIGGPGIVHLLNGMYDAKMDRVPQLILAGQTNSTLLGTKLSKKQTLLIWFQMYLYIITKFKKGDNVFEIVNKVYSYSI